MKLDKMLICSEILTELNDKGGISALSNLPQSRLQELIDIAPLIKGKRNIDALVQDYNEEYKRFNERVLKTYDKGEETQTSEKTVYDIIESYVHKIFKIGGTIHNLTLTQAFGIVHLHNKDVIWGNVLKLPSMVKSEASQMVIKSFIKRSNVDNWQENKRWLEFYI